MCATAARSNQLQVDSFLQCYIPYSMLKDLRKLLSGRSQGCRHQRCPQLSMCSLGWPECRSCLGLACAFCRRVDQRANGFRSFSTEEDLHTCDRLSASARSNGVTPTDSDT